MPVIAFQEFNDKIDHYIPGRLECIVLKERYFYPMKNDNDASI